MCGGGDLRETGRGNEEGGTREKRRGQGLRARPPGASWTPSRMAHRGMFPPQAQGAVHVRPQATCRAAGG